MAFGARRHGLFQRRRGFRAGGYGRQQAGGFRGFLGGPLGRIAMGSLAAYGARRWWMGRRGGEAVEDVGNLPPPGLS